ncbi:hypothetical protein [Botrimarina hoheduenensis]|uniref:Uncharacterized protein n=1 Tax=Botrimarina hoheduenensis TaxID=2528000 RepID=A0A5C5W9F3_9BACT|nr:hypothetical protein [Botrimarina hoheduenensis]TWT46641.1 hypothetical protein Pla111_17420 [Botrimarina hoheduenensis]
MDFRDRLRQATQKGASARAEKAFSDAADAASEEEQRRRHSQHRLALTDHIEERLQELADGLPGFKVEAVMSERGWGAAASRDDAGRSGRQRDNLYSRLELLVSSFNEFQVVDIAAKGAIRNKETFSRTHYQAIAEFDEQEFKSLIDRWVLDYAGQYAGV